jgi:hypothetical protein
VTGARRGHVSGWDDRVLRCHRQREPVPAALGRQPLPAPGGVLGDVVRDEHRQRAGPGGQPHRLGDRIAVPDQQIATALAQPLPQICQRLSEEPGAVRRRGQRRVCHEHRHHLACPLASLGQHRIVIHPQVAGEQHDRDVHQPPSYSSCLSRHSMSAVRR